MIQREVEKKNFVSLSLPREHLGGGFSGSKKKAASNTGLSSAPMTMHM